MHLNGMLLVFILCECRWANIFGNICNIVNTLKITTIKATIQIFSIRFGEEMDFVSGWIFLPFVLPWVLIERLNCIPVLKFYVTLFQKGNFPEVQQFVVFNFSLSRFDLNQREYTLNMIFFPILTLMLCCHNCQDKSQVHQISLPKTLKHHSQCVRRSQSVPLPLSLKQVKTAVFFFLF